VDILANQHVTMNNHVWGIGVPSFQSMCNIIIVIHFLFIYLFDNSDLFSIIYLFICLFAYFVSTVLNGYLYFLK